MTVGTDHPAALRHPAVTSYLMRLDAAAAAALPPGRRHELLTDIQEHLMEALAAADPDDEATIRAALDRLGAPEDIVAAEGPDPGVVRRARAPLVAPVPAPSPWGALEVMAVLALTVGTFVLPVVGPLVGIILAWGSVRWTRVEKLIATLLTLLPLVVLAVGAALTIRASTSGYDEPLPVYSILDSSAGGAP